MSKLALKNLNVSVGETSILHDVSLSFDSGKTYAILGHNGSGKSSLSLAIMGHPKYAVQSGSIMLDGTEISSLTASERASSGLFLSLQNVPEIPGVKLSEFLRTIYNIRLSRTNPEMKPMTPFLFKRFIAKEAAAFNIPEGFLERDLNVGFSGGEKRRVELLQAKLLDAKVAIFDEIDSGLDVDAFRLVSEALVSLKSENRAVIVVTHNFELLRKLSPDRVIIMNAGSVEREGGMELVEEVAKVGFIR